MQEMKNRYRLVCYRKRGGAFYLHDKQTGHREPLDTTDEDEALELLVTKNEADRNPALNRKKARIFLLASDPEAVTRTWTDALEALIDTKREGSEVRHRWETFSRDEALEPILDVVLLETSAQQLLTVAMAPTVSTNVFLRRLHNFCLGMNWLIEPILPKALWPKIKFRKKRAIKLEEHLKIIEREHNLERKAFYELCWHLGGSQGDIANLQAEDVDWTDRTVCYLRVSGKGQIDGDGFPRQRESVTNYARRNRMEIVNEFRDEGVTGTLFDRPGLTELFLALKAGDVKVVLVEKADRLARDLIVSETLLAEFRKLGVKVVAAEGGTDLTVDNDDPSRKMIRQILGVVSEWEKSCIVQKLRAARVRSKEKNGRCEGQKPYGDKEGESEIVARIQNLRNDRLTINEIADRLNVEGVRTRSGGQWHFTQIRRILARA